jgi:PKD repeat protein
MKPVANFSYISNPSNPLQLNFTGGLSLNGENITTYSWNFGDATTGTGQNVSKTYSTTGIYLVTLQVTNTDGSTTSAQFVVCATTAPIFLPIDTLVSTKLGIGLIPASVIDVYKKEWQLYLQPQINPEPIADADVFDESKWPALVNILISELIIYKVLTSENNKTLLDTLKTMQTSGTESTDTSSGGAVKKIETGPSNVEFYEDSKKDLDKISSFLSQFFKNQGLMAEYKQSICALAQRVKVRIPFCGQNKKPLILPDITTQDPALIITKIWP